MENWVTSDWKDAEGATGKFDISAGQFFKDESADKGTKSQASFFSTRFLNIAVYGKWDHPATVPISVFSAAVNSLFDSLSPFRPALLPRGVDH